MRLPSCVLGLLLVTAALVGCGGDDSRPATDGGEEGTTHEGGADADADADGDDGLGESGTCVPAECEASCPHITGGPPYGICVPEMGCVCTHTDPGRDADDDTDADTGDAATPCSDASFPNEGDLCTLADREANVACRTCSCSTDCCPTCVCGTDLRWSCSLYCQDTGLDGGGEGCDLGTPPRCRSSCAP
jgi:hypothetical protein